MPFLSHFKTILYRRPKDEVLRMLRWGPVAYLRCDGWARKMEASVACLKSNPLEHSQRIDCWFLTGNRFWYQTAYCAWTLERQTRRKVVLNVIDDGSLQSGQIAELRRLFPEGQTIAKSDIEKTLCELLPSEKFPFLRRKWNDYINIRKLIDVHLGSTGPKLVLDSDMLFFDRPDGLLQWIDQPTGICLMTHCVESYGYSRSLMESICGKRIPPLLNVGVTGLSSESIDWEMLESWTRSLIEAEGNSYYLEQALIAMLAAKNGLISVLPAEQYITFPTRKQVEDRVGVLQHYVADSKPWYFGNAWKRSMQRGSIH